MLETTKASRHGRVRITLSSLSASKPTEAVRGGSSMANSSIDMEGKSDHTRQSEPDDELRVIDSPTQ